MKTILLGSVLAMISAGIYGTIDVAQDMYTGQMINYDHGKKNSYYSPAALVELALDDYSRGEISDDYETNITAVPQISKVSETSSDNVVATTAVTVVEEKEEKTEHQTPEIRLEMFSRSSMEELVEEPTDSALVSVNAPAISDSLNTEIEK